MGMQNLLDQKPRMSDRIKKGKHTLKNYFADFPVRNCSWRKNRAIILIDETLDFEEGRRRDPPKLLYGSDNVANSR